MSRSRLNWIRTIIITTALVFITMGIYRGEVQTVLSKAIQICLECIGIG